MIQNRKCIRIFGKTLTWRVVNRCNLLQFGGVSLGALGLLAKEHRIGIMPLLGEEISLRVL